MAGFSGALRELANAQKSGKGVSLYSRFVNRPAGRLLAAASYSIGLTPNQVTLVSAVFTFSAVGAIAATRPSHGLALAVFAGLVLGFAFDSADGQLARLLTHRRNRPARASGEWLDHMVDCAKMLALHMAVLVSFHRFFDLSDRRLLLIPVVFQFTAVMVFFGGILTQKLKEVETLKAAVASGQGHAGAGSSTPSTARSVALLPVDYGLLSVVFLSLGDQTLFLSLYGALLIAHVLFMVAFLVKWFRELSG